MTPIIAGIITLALTSSWWLALLVAVGVWVIPLRAANNKLLFILDTETGEMKAQPQDKASEEYLRKRGNV